MKKNLKKRFAQLPSAEMPRPPQNGMRKKERMESPKIIKRSLLIVHSYLFWSDERLIMSQGPVRPRERTECEALRAETPES